MKVNGVKQETIKWVFVNIVEDEVKRNKHFFEKRTKERKREEEKF